MSSQPPNLSTRIQQAIALGLAPDQIARIENVSIEVVEEVERFLDDNSKEPEGNFAAPRKHHRRLAKLVAPERVRANA